MSDRFDYFVIFAEMRTGSNFLETNLNTFQSLTCYGEAFNPHFIGYPNKTEILGLTQEARDQDPVNLIETIKRYGEGLSGFRYFHDHDSRVLDTILDDRRCAKIILTRNPAESYVSWKIAQETGQWKLTNVKRRKDAKARFEPEEFDRHVAAVQDFQVLLMNRLQTSGQTAFYIDYEDLQDLAVINGMASFLGVDEQLEALDDTLKIQNPAPLASKVVNFDEMERALSGVDRFNLSRTPNFEPRRGAAVPGFVTGATLPVLYMPVRSGPEDEVLSWMAAVDQVSIDDLPTKLNQKALRRWKRTHPGHRSFTVLRHPLARAHHAFCNRILPRGEGTFADIRKTLRNFYKLPIPGAAPDESYDVAAHRAAFVGFLEFLNANLNGQTSIRVDACWASQASILQGMAQFALPDLILRETDMAAYLPAIALQLGVQGAPDPAVALQDTPHPLSAIYDQEIEDLASTVYQRDYVMFGFEAWSED